MAFSTQTYNVVPVHEFLDYLSGGDNESASDLMDKISCSGEVSFGDAVDTILTAQDVCDIVEVNLPVGLDPTMLIGLGS